MVNHKKFRYLESDKAKEEILRLYRDECVGLEAAVARTGYSYRQYENWRRDDPGFKAAIENAKVHVSGKGMESRAHAGSFEDFCPKYLFQPLYAHQLQWVDLLEGRSPRELHPAQTYEFHGQTHFLVNTPPEHSAEVTTPILTEGGWKTVGEVNPGDRVYDADGVEHPVYEVTDRQDVELFRVTFNTGDSVVTDAQHVWEVQRSAAHPPKLMSTATLSRDLRSPSGQLKWRIPVAPMGWYDQERELPVDPYVLGYWLGDGETGGSRIAVGTDDLEPLVANLELAGYVTSAPPQKGGYIVTAYGLRTHLRQLGVMHEKAIPTDYLSASRKQRLALLQGLFDSDGTITAKDGRARFVQHGRPTLCQSVYRLIASLGYQPRMKRYGPAAEISFKPDEEPVFRLARKASRQFTRAKNRRTDFRTVVSVEPAGRGDVRCISCTSDGNTYVIGDGLVKTRNAKSTTLTINYITYLICKNPNIRVRVVSKTQTMAKEFVYAIQQRLTHPKYHLLQRDFAPGGGFRGQSAVWKQDCIYLGAEVRDSGEKDPTLQALGIGGQIYGARADIIIVDDAVVLSNANEYEKQIRWLQQEVLTRLGPTGRLLVIGTRVDSVDLYKELRNGDRYPSGTSPWTYLAQPAVLEFAEKPEDWKTLWPKAQIPWDGARDRPDAKGLYPRWDGRYLNQRRGLLDPKTWAMAYMQADVSEENVFAAEAIRRCVNGMRRMGAIMRPNQQNVRPQGMEGLHIIGSLDPAMSGDGAFIVLGFDRVDNMRYLLEARVKTAPTPAWITGNIHELTEKWGIHEWVIEKNGYQASITKDLDLLSWFSARGITLHPHFTGTNKTDPDWGVASMAGLFANALIELPSSVNAEAIKQLIEQLITWRPNRPNDPYRGKTDLVMALWFAELRAREMVQKRQAQRAHIPNKYLSRSARFNQYVVPAGWSGA